MKINFLDELKTKNLGLIKTKDPIVIKKISELNFRPVLIFPEINLNNLEDFKGFFNNAGTLYLKALLKLMHKKFSDLGEGDMEKALENWSGTDKAKGEKAEYVKNNYSDIVALIDESYGNVDWLVFGPIYEDLMGDKVNYKEGNIKDYLEGRAIINEKLIDDLHNFIYGNEETYYDRDIKDNKKISFVIEGIQEELREYIKIYKGQTSSHPIYTEKKLFSYLDKLRIHGDLERDGIFWYDIDKLYLNDLLILELLSYLFDEKNIGQCAYCHKNLIVTTKQMRYWQSDKPIYCQYKGCDWNGRLIVLCQEKAKNARGYRKKLKKSLGKII